MGPATLLHSKHTHGVDDRGECFYQQSGFRSDHACPCALRSEGLCARPAPAWHAGRLLCIV